MIPAQNLEAEKQLLGAMLLDNARVSELAADLSPTDFYEPRHRLVFQAILACCAKLVPADYVTVGVELAAMRSLESVGGRAFLCELTADITSSAHAKYHLRIVKDAARLRSWSKLSTDALEAINNVAAGSDASESMQDELATRAVSIGAELQPEPEQMAIIAERVVGQITADRNGIAQGLPTGLKDLDRQLCGLRGGDLVILAARPGMGKTALATLMIRSAALATADEHVLFCSLEMGRDAIVERMVCEAANVSLHKLRKYGAAPSEREALRAVEADMRSLPLTIQDSPSQSPMSIRGMAQRVRHKHKKLSLIVVDYLQLVRVRNPESRYMEVSEVSRSLKQIAREFNVPVVALSQLSRKVEERPNKTPQLSDLRESGSIEQDADLVIFIYRASYYDTNAKDKLAADIILAKNRNGPVGQVTVNFDAERMRFADRAKVEEFGRVGG